MSVSSHRDRAGVMRIARQAVVLAFVALLFAPMIAISRSPKLTVELVPQLLNPASRPHAVEILRRSTPLWNDAVAIYNTGLYYLQTSNNTAIGVIGQDGWVFLGDFIDKSFSQNIHRLVMSDQDRDYWIASLEAQRRYLARRNIPMVFIVGPSTGTIYADKLPAWTQPLLTGPTSFDKVLAADTSHTILDLRPQLKAARAVADTYSKINSHWNDFGAWVAWQSIAAELGRKVPGFQGFGVGHLVGIDRIKNYANEFGDMLGLLVKNRWNRYVLDQPFPDFLIVNPDGSTTPTPGYTPTELQDLPRETISPNATSNLTALVVRDSMGNSLSPFIQASFRHVYQVNHHHAANAKDELNLIAQVERVKPDVVIYIMTERFFSLPLGNTFYWLSEDRFASLGSENESTWSPANGAQARFTLSGNGQINSPVVIDLSGTPPATKGRAMQVKFHSDGWGYISLSYKLNGEAHFLNEAYYAGPNELYFELPLAVDDDKVTLIKGIAETPPVNIQSVTLRQ
jgi:hypothetical protein